MSYNYDRTIRDLDYDATDFNRDFEESEREDNLNTEVNFTVTDDIVRDKLPHQYSIEEIIISIREVFFTSLEYLVDKRNPIPFIFSTERRKFAFASFLVIFGALLLLLSNIMK